MQSARKISIFILILFLLITSVPPVHAEDNTYTINALDLSLTIPDTYDVFTRNIRFDDPLLSKYHMTKSEVLKLLDENNIYLNAQAKNGNYEISVTAVPNTLAFDTLDDTVLAAFASAMTDKYAEYSMIITEYNIYQGPQFSFIKMNIHDQDETTFAIQYFTIQKNQAISLTLYSYNHSITPILEHQMQQVVDSVYMSSYVPPVTEHRETKAFLYSFDKSHIHFTVPENWEQQALNEDRDILKAKFSPTDNSVSMISYGCYDLWESLSYSEKQQYSRSDIKNSMFTMEEFAAILEVSVDELEVVSYNGLDYYKYWGEYPTEEFGITLTLPNTVLTRIENGWLHTFYFFGTPDNEHYEDFEKLMQSVQYGTDNHYLAWWIGLGILSVLVLLIAILIFWGKAKKHPSQNNMVKKENNSGYSTKDTPKIKNTKIYCRMCGTELPSDSLFCHKCGTPVYKDRDIS